MPIREIARRTGLSRNTVRKYLANQTLEPSYPQRHSPSKLDSYGETLTNWLFRESRRHRKQRRTVKRLYLDLVSLGYTGSSCWARITGVRSNRACNSALVASRADLSVDGYPLVSAV
jgi:hypothetical protein